MNAKRYELAVATVLLGGVALAGCSQQSAVSPATTGAIAPSSTATAPPPAPVTAPSSTATAPPPAPTSADVVPVASPADTPICTTAQLSASLVPDRGGASAGHFAVWLRVQNTSSRVCRIDGYGGVSLVGDNNGTQLGAPADRTPATVTPTILISGAHAQELLQITQPGDYGPSVTARTPTVCGSTRRNKPAPCSPPMWSTPAATRNSTCCRSAPSSPSANHARTEFPPVDRLVGTESGSSELRSQLRRHHNLAATPPAGHRRFPRPDRTLPPIPRYLSLIVPTTIPTGSHLLH
jgi:hypothetical protein